MSGDPIWRAAEAAEARWLICVELQQDKAAAGSRGGLSPDELDNCRTLLARARGAGWPVVHVHLRRPGADGPLPAARAMEGFEPLPTEAVFFRDGGPNCAEDPFWRTADALREAEALVVGFIDDRTCAGAVASLSRAGVPVTLVEDAICGAYAHAFIERRVETAATRDLVCLGRREFRPPDWLCAANAP